VPAAVCDLVRCLDLGFIGYYALLIFYFYFLEYVQRFRGGLVFKAHELCVSLNSRLESNKEEEGWQPGRLRISAAVTSRP